MAMNMFQLFRLATLHLNSAKFSCLGVVLALVFCFLGWGLPRGVLMSLCRSFSFLPVAYIAWDKCCCRKLSLFYHQFLSAVGVLEQDCRYIFSNFAAMSPVAKTPWKASRLASFSSDNAGISHFHYYCSNDQRKWKFYPISLMKFRESWKICLQKQKKPS